MASHVMHKHCPFTWTFDFITFIYYEMKCKSCIARVVRVILVGLDQYFFVDVAKMFIST